MSNQMCWLSRRQGWVWKDRGVALRSVGAAKKRAEEWRKLGEVAAKRAKTEGDVARKKAEEEEERRRAEERKAKVLAEEEEANRKAEEPYEKLLNLKVQEEEARKRALLLL